MVSVLTAPAMAEVWSMVALNTEPESGAVITSPRIVRGEMLVPMAIATIPSGCCVSVRAVVNKVNTSTSHLSG
jgi:hypothetical protein